FGVALVRPPHSCPLLFPRRRLFASAPFPGRRAARDELDIPEWLGAGMTVRTHPAVMAATLPRRTKRCPIQNCCNSDTAAVSVTRGRSEEHTSELQSREKL